jgi:hypothetical protein
VPTLSAFIPSPEAYADLASLWNRLQPPWPRDPEVWARIDGRASAPTIRVVAHDGDTLVGAADAVREDGSAVPDAYSVTVFVDEDRAGAADLAGALHDAVVPPPACGRRPLCLRRGQPSGLAGAP